MSNHRHHQSKSTTSITSTYRQHTVKVNHVPLSVSKQQLKDLFDVHGSCDVHLRCQYGQTEQHAFINFTSHEAAQTAAKKLHGTIVSGGKITVKLQRCSCSMSSGSDNYTVKVENLSKEVTEETLKEVFGCLMNTELISVKINTPDKSPFNYAYINYSNVHDAQRAIKELNGSKILGSTVRVKIHNSENLDARSPTSFPAAASQSLQTSGRYPIAPHQVPSTIPTVQPLPPATYWPCHSRFIPFPQPSPHGYHVLPAFPSPSVIQPGGYAIFRPPPPAAIVTLPPAEPAGVLTRPPLYDSSKPPLSNAIKVTIHGHLTAEDLEMTFDQFGTITTKPNIITGTPDFAYINYESPDQAQVAALSMHQQKINGVLVHVKVKKDDRRSIAPTAPISSHDYEKIHCEPLIVQVITSPDLPEFKLQLQGIESSMSVRVMPMKSGKGFSISGNQESLEEAQSLLKVVISKAQEKIKEESFTVPCHYVPLFINQEILTKIAKVEQKHCVEFHIFDSSTQHPVEISVFSKYVAIQFVSHTNSPATIGCVSRYLYTSITKETEALEDDLADVWEWQDDSGRFEPYGADQCKEFSVKFRQDPTSTISCLIRTKLGLTEYTINFKTLTQTNNATGKCRQIQHNAQSMTGSSAIWYYTDDQKELIPYTRKQSFEIERAWISGTKTLSMTINEKRYQLNLTQMKQINSSTHHERTISRMLPSSHLLNFQVHGLKENLKEAVLDLKEELQASVVTMSITLPSDSEGAFHNSLRELIDECFVSASICDDVIHIEGVQGYIDKVAIKIREEKLSFETKILSQRSSATASNSLSIPPPVYWEVQTEEIALKTVLLSSKEWKDVEILMHSSLPSAQIRTLQRIQNKWLWEKYCFSKERMTQQNNGAINEKELFHGTSTTPPEKIYKSRQGFDFRFGSKQNLWGTGTYFAVSAKYSDANYAYHLSGDNVKQLILAKVLTGEAYQSPSANRVTRALTKPPVKESSIATCSSGFVDELYDSVHGNAQGSDIYVIYDHDKAYPDYLITYVTNHSYLFS